MSRLNIINLKFSIVVAALNISIWAAGAVAYPGSIPKGPGDDVGTNALQVDDGGYVIAGFTTEVNGKDADVVLIKTDAKGNEQWNKTYEGNGEGYPSYAYAVIQTKDKGFAIIGNTNSIGKGGYDVLLIKTDSQGNEQWNKTYGTAWVGDECGCNIIQNNDGGYIIIGGSNSTDTTVNAGSNNALLIKTNANGKELWHKTIGAEDKENEIAYSAQNTSDGGYILVGSRSSPNIGNGSDLLLVKLDNRGDVEWNVTIGSELAGEERANSVQQTKDGGYIVAGWTNSSGTGTFDALIIKTDANGKMEWNRSIGEKDMDNDTAYSIVETSDGGYIMAGTESSLKPEEGDNILVVKLDAQGKDVWTKIFGSDWKGLERASDIDQVSDGGYIITGWTTSIGDNTSDILLGKLNQQGAEEWHKIFNIEGN